jgi:DNA-binding NarL/FixJ family response regulator
MLWYSMETNKLIKVLLVENRRILRTGFMLEVICETDNGIDAVEKASSLKPDVIIMDISLRGISGIDPTAQIKDKRPRVRILALTSHEEESSILSAFSAGIDRYCPKDVLEPEPYQAIKTVWAGDV